MLARLVLHPRRAFDEAAAEPNLRRGGLAVAATGVICAGLELGAITIGVGSSAAVILSIAVPAMLAVFWLASAVLVGAGARLMGHTPRHRELLAVSGLTFPVLVLYAVIALVQSASTQWGGDTLSTAAGLLAFPVVCWFVALNALAVRAVYHMPALSAVAVALLPYAALSAVLLLLVIVVSALHALRVV